MEIHVKAGQYTVVAGGPADWLEEMGQKLKDSMVDHALEDANSWVQMPSCPNLDCGRKYEYNLRTGVTQK